MIINASMIAFNNFFYQPLLLTNIQYYSSINLISLTRVTDVKKIVASWYPSNQQ